MTTETSTRHTGFCAACGRAIKVRDHQGAMTLVHHGYQRPGDGQIHGDCYGVHRPPHELSPDVAQECLDDATAALERGGQMIAQLKTVTTLTVQRRKPGAHWSVTESVTLTKGETHRTGWPGSPDWEFEQARESALHAQDHANRQAHGEIHRLTPLVTDWTPRPLRLTEELVTAAAAAKEAEKAARQQAREDRYWALVEKLRGRIDSAVKNRSSGSLRDIWTTGYGTLHDKGLGRSREQVRADVDRENVWAAFGLASFRAARWRHEEPEARIIRAMDSRQDRIKYSARLYTFDREVLARMTLEWPEALGGEDRKGSKTLAEVRALLAR